MGTRVAPGGRVSYNRSARLSIKWVRKLYLDVPPPVCCMLLRIYSVSTVVVFPPRRIDQVISVCDRAKEIPDTIEDITIEEWHRSAAIFNMSFKLLQICTVRIQDPVVILQGMHRIITG